MIQDRGDPKRHLCISRVLAMFLRHESKDLQPARERGVPQKRREVLATRRVRHARH